jgi:hypothetical protein
MKTLVIALSAGLFLCASLNADNVTVVNPTNRPVPVTMTGTPAPVPPLPTGANAKVASSGNVAAAAATATLAAVAARTNYITGFQITASGATAALTVNATVTGLKGGTLTYTFVFPAGVDVPATPLNVAFPEPMPANAANLAISVSLPASGAGGTHAAVNVQGFDL